EAGAINNREHHILIRYPDEIACVLIDDRFVVGSGKLIRIGTFGALDTMVIPWPYDVVAIDRIEVLNVDILIAGSRTIGILSTPFATDIAYATVVDIRIVGHGNRDVTVVRHHTIHTTDETICIGIRIGRLVHAPLLSIMRLIRNIAKAHSH